MIIIATIYPHIDYSKILYLEGRRCSKSYMLKALCDAIVLSRKENRPVELECVMRIIRVKDIKDDQNG